jgi:hypothetical protein
VRSARPPTCAGEREASQTSSGPSPRRSADAMALASSAANESATPRGRPAVPEVHRIACAPPATPPSASRAASRSGSVSREESGAGVAPTRQSASSVDHTLRVRVEHHGDDGSRAVADRVEVGRALVHPSASSS